MKLEGVRIVCTYPKLNLDTLWRQWEMPIVKSHTEGQQIRLSLMVKSLINIFIFGTRIGYLVMRVIMIAVPKEETTSRITQVIVLRKTSAQKNQKFGAIVFLLRREAGSVGFAWCLIRRVVPSVLPVRQKNDCPKLLILLR